MQAERSEYTQTPQRQALKNSINILHEHERSLDGRLEQMQQVSFAHQPTQPLPGTPIFTPARSSSSSIIQQPFTSPHGSEASYFTPSQSLDFQHLRESSTKVDHTIQHLMNSFQERQANWETEVATTKLAWMKREEVW